MGSHHRDHALCEGAGIHPQATLTAGSRRFVLQAVRCERRVQHRQLPLRWPHVVVLHGRQD